MTADVATVTTTGGKTGDAAARVRAQLQPDFPDGALAWVDDLKWSGPVMVPLRQIDFSRSLGWSASSDRKKVAMFAQRMRQGWRKPIVLVRTPGGHLTPVDGHTRLLAARQIGQPVTAWIGLASATHGPWEQTHARQNP